MCVCVCVCVYVYVCVSVFGDEPEDTEEGASISGGHRVRSTAVDAYTYMYIYIYIYIYTSLRHCSQCIETGGREREEWEGRGGVNAAHARQSRPDFGLGFKAKVLKTFQVVPVSRRQLAVQIKATGQDDLLALYRSEAAG